MSIALLTSTSDGGTMHGVTSSAINTTGATLLIAAVTYYGSTSATTTHISDSQGNTWTQLTDYSTNTDQRVRLFFCLEPSTGAAHTLTVSKTSSYPSICFSAWSGVASNDSESGASTSSATAIQPGSITPAANGALLITSIVARDNTVYPYIIDSGFTELTSVAFQFGAHMGCEVAYLIQPTAAAVNPTWSWFETRWAAANMACFLPASGGFQPAWAVRRSSRIIGSGLGA